MMDYWPNIDAVDWMARTILPEIRRRRPAANFAIVGAAPAPNVIALGALPGVTVTGRVPDVRPYLAHADVFVAPLRISRGVQNKVLEGMAMARAVVATPDAYEGIEAESGREILVAPDVDAFATLVVDLLESRERAAEIGRAARARVIESYAWQASFARLDALCGSGGDTTPPVGDTAHAMVR
jgi:glycosyltransferase involved in cell wall biosynthesis